MSSVWPSLFLSLLAAVISALLVWYLTHRWRDNTRQQCEKLLFYTKKEAEISSREILNEAQVKIDKKWSELERRQDRFEIERERDREEIDKDRRRLKQLREELEERRNKLQAGEESVYQREEALRKTAQQYRRRMEEAAGLSADEVKKALRDEVAAQCRGELRHLRRSLLEKSEKEVRREAKRLLVSTMQRLSTQPLHDITATLVPIPGDEMKGRIIGREGRNIKCFEAVTGVTLMIDESPGTVLISSFDPVRREVARVGLEYLIEDGRIHPSSIEEYVARAQSEIESDIVRYGDEAVDELKLGGVHAEVLHLLGKLKYRYAFTQNVLDHSVEVAFLCSMLASELGVDPLPAKRAGLFHDIGKAIDHEYEGSHATVGGDFLRRYGEDPVVVNAVAAHHEEVEAETIYAGIVMVADTLSAVRPGVRNETQSAYIERLERLETLAGKVEGVREVYALQAGREIRVLVEPSEVTDERASEIAKELRHEIENNLQYPSTIKITVIREQRYNETAK